MGFLTVTSSAAGDAFVHFTGEKNLTETVVTMICLSCWNDYGFMIRRVTVLWLENEQMSYGHFVFHDGLLVAVGGG